MINIAICDDERECGRKLEDCIKEYAFKNNKDVSVHFFDNPVNLLGEIDTGNSYDLFFLDIIMPDMNGIELGAELKKRKSDSLLCYLTTSDDFTKEAYRLDALSYLEKPFEKERIFFSLDRCFSLLKIKDNSMVTVQTVEGFRSFSVNMIQYVEHFNHVLTFHLTDQTSFNSSNSSLTLKELMLQIRKLNSSTASKFVSPHRAFVVNLEEITMLGNEGFLIIGDRKIYISKSRFAKLKEEYMNHFLEKKE